MNINDIIGNTLREMGLNNFIIVDDVIQIDDNGELRELTLEESDNYSNTLTRLEAEYNANEYQRLRTVAYNERGATIEALVVAQQEALEGDDATLEAIKIVRAEVKALYPKPS